MRAVLIAATFWCLDAAGHWQQCLLAAHYSARELNAITED